MRASFISAPIPVGIELHGGEHMWRLEFKLVRHVNTYLLEKARRMMDKKRFTENLL